MGAVSIRGLENPISDTPITLMIGDTELRKDTRRRIADSPHHQRGLLLGDMKRLEKKFGFHVRKIL